MRDPFFIATILFLFFHSDAQTSTISAKSSADSNGVYTFVEHNPEFPGGDAELLKFIQRNIQVPAADSEFEYMGCKILLSFVIDTDGSIRDVNLIKLKERGWNYEITRLLKLLPRFKPGIQDGKAVKVYFRLPILLEPGRSLDKH